MKLHLLLAQCLRNLTLIIGPFRLLYSREFSGSNGQLIFSQFLIVSLAALHPIPVAGVDGTAGMQIVFSNPTRAGESLKPGWGLSAYGSFDLLPRLGVFTGFEMLGVNTSLGSAFYWNYLGLDLGLQYRPPGLPHFSPFVRSGLGFRSVALLKPYTVKRPVERYRWYYDEYGNVVEMRADQTFEYDYYSRRLTDYETSPLFFSEVGISFPVNGDDYGDFALAPELTLRYERTFREIHGMDFSSLKLSLGFTVLF